MARRLLAGLLFVTAFATTMAVEHQRHQKRNKIAIAISAPQRSPELAPPTELNHTMVNSLQSPRPPTRQALKSSADAARAAADAAANIESSN